MRSFYYSVGILGALLFCATQAFAETITIANSADMVRLVAVLPDTVFPRSGVDFHGGTEDAYASVGVMHVGTDVQGALAYYDLSSIPTGATIVSATLSIYHDAAYYGGQPTGTSASVYRVTTAWSNPTWNDSNSTTGTKWTTAGGDYTGINGSTTAYATNSTTVANDEDVTLTFDLTTLVNEWLSGTYANDGLILTGSAGDTLHFTGLSLNVVYTTAAVPEPSTFALLCVSGFGLICYAWRSRSKRNVRVS